MLSDRVSNAGPLTYESGALPIADSQKKYSIFIVQTMCLNFCIKSWWCFYKNDLDLWDCLRREKFVL